MHQTWSFLDSVTHQLVVSVGEHYRSCKMRPAWGQTLGQGFHDWVTFDELHQSFYRNWKHHLAGSVNGYFTADCSTADEVQITSVDCCMSS